MAHDSKIQDAAGRRGWQGAVLRAMRAPDYRLDVTSSTPVGEYYLRVGFHCPRLFADRPQPHPTMWLRLWFPNAGRPHQRGYTVVDPDPVAGEFVIEFALHGGPACQWARAARPGDTISATLLGSAAPEPMTDPRRWLIVGDTASLPAINSLLDALGDRPADVVLEYQRDAEADLPVRSRASTTVEWVPRERGGAGLVDRVGALLPDLAADTTAAWVACDTKTTRALVAALRARGLPRKMIISQGYWVASGS